MEGPRRGFSLKGWKENRPKTFERRHSRSLPMCAGQLLAYIEYENNATLTTNTSGTSHGIHGFGTGGEKRGVVSGASDWLFRCPVRPPCAVSSKSDGVDRRPLRPPCAVSSKSDSGDGRPLRPPCAVSMSTGGDGGLFPIGEKSAALPSLVSGGDDGYAAPVARSWEDMRKKEREREMERERESLNLGRNDRTNLAGVGS